MVQELAFAGDMQACRRLLDRVLPRLTPTDTPTAFPHAREPAETVQGVLGSLSAGTITIPQGADLAGVLTALVKVREATDIEARIAAPESKP